MFRHLGIYASLAELILSEMLKEGAYPSIFTISTYFQFFSSSAFARFPVFNAS